MTTNITSVYSDEKQQQNAMQRVVKELEKIMISAAISDIQSEEDKRIFNEIDQMVISFSKTQNIIKYIVKKINKATNEIIYSCRFNDLNRAYSYIEKQSPFLLLDYRYTVEEII